MYVITCNTILLPDIANVDNVTITDDVLKKALFLLKSVPFRVSLAQNINGVKFAIGSFEYDPIAGSRRNLSDYFLR